MRLHLLGLFHTIPHPDYSHCAFTGRVIRFGKMMLPYGYEVIEYSNAGGITQASEHVTILTREEFAPLQARMKAAPQVIRTFPIAATKPNPPRNFRRRARLGWSYWNISAL